jgi:hypothetical protein
MKITSGCFFQMLTLSLAAGEFKFHPYLGRTFKEYKGKR